MNKQLQCILVLLGALCIGAVAVAATNPSGKVRLIKPIDLAQDNKESEAEAQALFENITAQAREAGLGEVTLIGKVHNVGSGDHRRVAIIWHTIEKNEGGRVISRALQTGFISRFTTDEGKVNPGLMLTIRGDFEALMVDYAALQDTMEEAAESEVTVALEEDEPSAAPVTGSSASASREFPGASGGAGGSDAASAGTSDAPESANSGVDSTRYLSCAPRIDESAELVYPQQQRIVADHTGAETERSTCYDAGAPIQLVRDYRCDPVVDIENRTGFASYKLTYSLDGSEVEYQDCRVDNARVITVQTKIDGCSVKHDFIADLSIQQEYLYYTDEQGGENALSGCVDSAVTYAHFATDQTCSPTVDEVNNLAFIQTRIAFINAKDTVEYASECAPIDTDGTSIIEQSCADQYEHDFTVGQSYWRTYTYYLGTRGEEIIVNACQRSTTTAFAHEYDETECGITNDDEHLRTIFQKETFIDTPDGRIVIALCAESGQTTSYASLPNFSRALAFDANVQTFGQSHTRSAASFVGNGISASDPLNVIRGLYRER